MDKDIIYGYHAAAELCGVSPQTVRNWVKNGKLFGCYTYVSGRKIAFSKNKLEKRLFDVILY